MAYFRDVAQRLGERPLPEWLSLDEEALSARILAFPSRDDVEIPLSEQLIVEYYSR